MKVKLCGASDLTRYTQRLIAMTKRKNGLICYSINVFNENDVKGPGPTGNYFSHNKLYIQIHIYALLEACQYKAPKNHVKTKT